METDDMAAVADTPHAPRLLDTLPAELLFLIAHHLSTTDYCALRLSCRTVERALYHPFSHEFFTRKQFMMSEFSLQALVDIAQHPCLSERLEHVSFGLDHPATSNARSISEERYHPAARSDQSTIFSSGRAVEMLTEAFSRLRNLKTVSIRDFNSRTRFRDFNNSGPYWKIDQSYWNSYGFRTQLMDTSHKQGRTFPGKKAEFLASLFKAVSTALAKSGARSKSFELLLQDRKSGLRDVSFSMPPRPHDQDSVRRMLSGLCKLHLSVALHPIMDDSLVLLLFRYYNLSIFPDGPHSHANPPAPDDDGIIAGINCRRYIAHTAPSLEWLRINFYELDHRDELADEFMAYFTNPTNSKIPGDRIVYPKLKRLDLGHAYVTPSSLCSMLEGLPSVEFLSLDHITLTSASRGPVPMLWQTFLQKLPVILPKLKRVDINTPGDMIRRRMYKNVIFVPASAEFSIQVGDGENALDVCTEAAAQLRYLTEPTASEPTVLDNDEDEGVAVAEEDDVWF